MGAAGVDVLPARSLAGVCLGDGRDGAVVRAEDWEASVRDFFCLFFSVRKRSDAHDVDHEIGTRVVLSTRRIRRNYPYNVKLTNVLIR